MTPRNAPEIEKLFPDVVAYEVWGDGDPEWLLEPEPTLVDRAVTARVGQFAAGRRCARMALESLGVEPAPLMRSTGRAPAWPEGFHGSISHTDGYAVAVVGRGEQDATSIGIDAERSGRIERRLHDRLFLVGEREWLSGLETEQRAEAATELFGLKESFYKAQFPLTGAWVGFHDVRIEHQGDHWDVDRATDLAALEAVRWPCIGHSLVRQSMVVTGVTVRSSENLTLVPSR